MNKAILIGRLTKDPELTFTPGKGTAVCKLTIAVDRRVKNENGQREADFIPVTIFGKPAENTANFMSKGSLIGISGRIQTGSYEKDGVKRYTTEVIADEVQFLSSKKDGQAAPPNETSYEDMTPVDDGDIPF